MSLARYHKGNNFIFETRFQRARVSKTKKPVQARTAVMPAVVGRNARLRAYPPHAVHGTERFLETQRRGIQGFAKYDLRGCGK